MRHSDGTLAYRVPFLARALRVGDSNAYILVRYHRSGEGDPTDAEVGEALLVKVPPVLLQLRTPHAVSLELVAQLSPALLVLTFWAATPPVRVRGAMILSRMGLRRRLTDVLFLCDRCVNEKCCNARVDRVCGKRAMLKVSFTVCVAGRSSSASAPATRPAQFAQRALSACHHSRHDEHCGFEGSEVSSSGPGRARSVSALRKRRQLAPASVCFAPDQRTNPITLSRHRHKSPARGVPLIRAVRLVQRWPSLLSTCRGAALAVSLLQLTSGGCAGVPLLDSGPPPPRLRARLAWPRARPA
jgi:hypothetical protein